jgi:hypothetical protein
MSVLRKNSKVLARRFVVSVKSCLNARLLPALWPEKVVTQERTASSSRASSRRSSANTRSHQRVSRPEGPFVYSEFRLKHPTSPERTAAPSLVRRDASLDTALRPGCNKYHLPGAIVRARVCSCRKRPKCRALALNIKTQIFTITIPSFDSFSCISRLPILEQLWFFLSDFSSFPTARAVPLNSSF